MIGLFTNFKKMYIIFKTYFEYLQVLIIFHIWIKDLSFSNIVWYLH